MGRYDEILAHIREHKWYINLKKAAEIPYAEAVASWYDTVYLPIVAIIRASRLLARFPGKTEADLYVFVGQHWSELNRRYGPHLHPRGGGRGLLELRAGPACRAPRGQAVAGALRRLRNG